MSFGSEEERHHRKGREPDDAERRAGDGRGRRGRGPWLLVAVSVVLLALLVAAAVLLWRSFGDSLSGTSTARDSVDSGPEPTIQLTNGPGQVSVEGVGDLEAVEYEVTKHAVASDPAAAKERAAGVPVDLSREGAEIVLQTDGGRGTGADYALRVPAGSTVEVESEAGDVEVAGVTGAVRVRAEAGDVTVTDVGGPVGVEAPAGDVAVSNMNTDTGAAELAVGSGDADLEDLVVGTLEANVEAGTVTVSGRFSGGGRVFVETGDIISRVPAEDARELALEAEVGEVVREEAPAEAPEGKDAGGGS